MNVLTPLDRERFNRLLDPLTLINADRQHSNVVKLTFTGDSADVTELHLQLQRWLMESDSLYVPIREARL